MKKVYVELTEDLVNALNVIRNHYESELPIKWTTSSTIRKIIIEKYEQVKNTKDA